MKLVVFDSTDELIVGKDTPDPLSFAFAAKRGAHAGGAMKPVNPALTQSVLSEALSLSGEATGRCLYIHIPFCRVRCTYCNFSNSSESIYSDLKASFDRGVLLKHELGEWFDALMHLFTAWQKRGLVNITPFAVELTLAGQFWAVTLATNAIQVIQNQTQAILKSA